jgi:hypothetical protein
VPELARKLSREIEMFLAWWAVSKKAISTEAELNKAMSKMFADLSAEVIRSMGNHLSDVNRASAGAKVKDYVDTLKDILFDYLKQAGKDGTVDTAAGMNLAGETKLAGTTLEALESRAFEASQATLDRVSGSVMDALSMAYDEGMSTDEAATLLKVTVFDGLETWEAERIARTEIHTAQGQASHAVIDENAEYRQWITAEDDRVRDGSSGDADHVSMHGEIVRSGDPYSNGLMYPGDMSGDIGEWIECRCVEVAFEMPAGMTAPEGMDYFFEEDLVELAEAA